MAARREDPVTGLTGPEEVFCSLVIKLGNAAEAYRLAFPVSPKWAAQSVAVKASQLQAEDKVKIRMSVLRSDMREDARITLAEHLEELKTLRELAKDSLQVSAAITAETNRGKASGLYIDKVDAKLSNPDGSPLFSAIERVIIDSRKK